MFLYEQRKVFMTSQFQNFPQIRHGNLLDTDGFFCLITETRIYRNTLETIRLKLYLLVVNDVINLLFKLRQTYFANSITYEKIGWNFKSGLSVTFGGKDGLLGAVEQQKEVPFRHNGGVELSLDYSDDWYGVLNFYMGMFKVFLRFVVL